MEALVLGYGCLACGRNICVPYHTRQPWKGCSRVIFDGFVRVWDLPQFQYVPSSLGTLPTRGMFKSTVRADYDVTTGANWYDAASCRNLCMVNDTKYGVRYCRKGASMMWVGPNDSAILRPQISGLKPPTNTGYSYIHYSNTSTRIPALEQQYYYNSSTRTLELYYTRET